MRKVLRLYFCLVLLCSAQASWAELGPDCASYLTSTKTVIEKIVDFIFRRKKPVKSPEQLVELELDIPMMIPSPIRVPESAEPKPPSQSQEQPEQPPKPKSGKSNSYTAQSKSVDTKPSEDPAQVMVSVDKPRLIYFATENYYSLDAASGVFSSSSNLFSQTSTANAMVNLTLNVSALPSSDGQLWIPKGYQVVTSNVGSMALQQTPTGLYFGNLPRGQVKVGLAPETSIVLSPQQVSVLTAVQNAPLLEQYPEKWREFIKELKQKQLAQRMGNLEVADELIHFMKANIKYEIDDSPEVGVLQFINKGTAQCDGSGLIFVTLMRSQFQIPCYAIGGIKSVQPVDTPETSVVLDQSTPHMFVDVYDERTKFFVVKDPTSSEATRDKNNPGKDDPRFNEWPDGAGESKIDENEVEEMLARLWPQASSTTNPIDARKAMNEIVTQLQLKNHAKELGPAHQAMLQNLNYVRSLSSSKNVTFADALESVNRLAERSREEQAGMKEQEQIDTYVNLQLLSRYGVYAAQYATTPEQRLKYHRVVEAASGLLEDLPSLSSKAPTLEKRLPGPFSRDLLKRGIAQEYRLEQLARLHEKVQLARLKNRRLVPSYRMVNTDSKQDDDEDYAIAEDFERWEHFERGGYPHTYDLPRVLMEDMLVRQWREPEFSGSFHVKPEPNGGKEITYILFDLSWSMQSGLLQNARDRLITTWIDEIMGNNPQAKVVLIGYMVEPTKEIVLMDQLQARRQFEQLFVRDHYFESLGGNDLAPAVERAAWLASREGPDLRKVNFRVVTDGAETMKIEMMRKIKDDLGGKNIELNFTAVTLEVGNEELKRFLTEASNTHLINEGVFVHLSSEEIEEILGSDRSPNKALLGKNIPYEYKGMPYVSPRSWGALNRAAAPF